MVADGRHLSGGSPLYAGAILSLTLPTRATCRRVVGLAVTLVVVAACGGSHESAPILPTASTTSVDTTSSASGLAPTSTSPETPTTTIPGSSVSSRADAPPTSADPSTVMTALDTSHRFDFKPPVTNSDDLPMLDVYRNFMAVEEQAELNPSDSGLQAQLAAITTSREYTALQTAFGDFVAKGQSYRVVAPAAYHPFVEYGDVYRDDFRRISDCFIAASAHADGSGTAVAGETLERQTYGFVVDFELHDGKWLASASYYDPGVCLAGR